VFQHIGEGLPSNEPSRTIHYEIISAVCHGAFVAVIPLLLPSVK
jgi:hypothetical protein